MPPTVLLAIFPIIIVLHSLVKARHSRTRKIPLFHERVLVLGASSGIGKSIAHKYAKRGARVCIVARRVEKVEETVQVCKAERGSKDGVLGCVADFTNVEDMIRVRNLVTEEWEGIDTLVVVAGVSALKPLLAIAGLDSIKTQDRPEDFDPPQADMEAIRRVVDITAAATKANYFGPLIAAVSFIPMLIRTSKAPSILHVSSLASVIAAPTRALYASTKSASLLLYQSLAIEHPGITFSLIMPSTVEGDFRASAVDGGSVREKDPNKSGLKREAVAERCIQAVDNNEKTVFIPGYMRLAHLLYWIAPRFIERQARVKYGFND